MAWFPGESIHPAVVPWDLPWSPPPTESISLPYPSIYAGTRKPAHRLHQEVPASPQALAREECGLTLPVGALASRLWQKRRWLSQQETGRGSGCPPRWSQRPRGGCPYPTPHSPGHPPSSWSGHQPTQLTPAGLTGGGLVRITWPVPLQTGAGRLQVGRSTSLGQFSQPGDPLLALEAVAGVFVH